MSEKRSRICGYICDNWLTLGATRALIMSQGLTLKLSQINSFAAGRREKRMSEFNRVKTHIQIYQLKPTFGIGREAWYARGLKSLVPEKFVCLGSGSINLV